MKTSSVGSPGSAGAPGLPVRNLGQARSGPLPAGVPELTRAQMRAAQPARARSHDGRPAPHEPRPADALLMCHLAEGHERRAATLARLAAEQPEAANAVGTANAADESQTITAFRQAVGAHDTLRAAALLAARPDLLRSQLTVEDGAALLRQAMDLNDLNARRAAHQLAEHIAPNTLSHQDEQGCTPLMWAIERRLEDLATVVLRRMELSAVLSADAQGRIALVRAIQEGQSDIARQLVEKTIMAEKARQESVPSCTGTMPPRCFQ